jgi:nucleotide-binding universal stress UspA family protein
MFKHIMLPTDGSELSNAAVQEGIRFAKSIRAQVTGICVMPSQQLLFYEGMNAELYLELQEKKRKELREAAEAFLSVIE